jgi:hypothetical protein
LASAGGSSVAVPDFSVVLREPLLSLVPLSGFHQLTHLQVSNFLLWTLVDAKRGAGDDEALPVVLINRS